jgi:hypothetical protein
MIAKIVSQMRHETVLQNPCRAQAKALPFRPRAGTLRVVSNVAIAQQILDGPWQYQAAARRACRDETWPAFVREAAPARPVLFGRGDHARCIALAETAPMGPVTATLDLVPLWGCVSWETPSNDWLAVHGVRWEGEVMGVQESSPFLEDASPRADALWVCKVRRWKAGIVVGSDAYAPSIPMRLRAGAFAVLEAQMVEVLAVSVHASAPVARPVAEVPLFSRRFLPRVAVALEFERAIDSLCFTAQSEEV